MKSFLKDGYALRPKNKEVYHICKEKLHLSEIQATLVAQRLDKEALKNLEKKSSYICLEDLVKNFINPKLNNLEHYANLKSIDKAARLLANFIVKDDRVLVLSSDYDVDGITALTLGRKVLIDYFGLPEKRLQIMHGERELGYGITKKVVEKILNIDEAGMLLSADHGSNDEQNLKFLQESIKTRGKKPIKICITDHHQIDKVPDSADCIVNPQQEGCKYDKCISGCFVLFLVLAATKNILTEMQYLNKTIDFKEVIDLVALSVISDSMSLASANNRIIVKHGLDIIRQKNNLIWQVCLNNKASHLVDAEFLSFRIIAVLNAANRVGNAQDAYKFLNSLNLTEAQLHFENLLQHNQTRKNVQLEMLQQARKIALEQRHQKFFIIVLTGKIGVVGVVANVLMEEFNRPTLILTEDEENPDLLHGSGRSSSNFLEIIKNLNDKFDLFLTIGGHANAFGMSIHKSKLSKLQSLAQDETNLLLPDSSINNVTYIDLHLNARKVNMDTYKEIKTLEPYGKDWDIPKFSGSFVINKIKLMGKEQNHISLNLNNGFYKNLGGIYFDASKELISYLQKTDKIQAIYKLTLNPFFNNKLQLHIIDFLECN